MISKIKHGGESYKNKQKIIKKTFFSQLFSTWPYSTKNKKWSHPHLSEKSPSSVYKDPG